MTDRQAQKYLQKVERIRRRYERRFTQAFINALRKQIAPILAELKKEGANPIVLQENISALISEEAMFEAYYNLVFEVTQKFIDISQDEVEQAVEGKSVWFTHPEMNISVKRMTFNADFWDMKVRDYLQKYAGEKITWITQTTKDWILQNIQAVTIEATTTGLGIPEMTQQIISRMNTEFPNFAKYRAERIARTEVVSASNWGSYQTAQSVEGDVIKKKWIAAIQPNRTRPSHLALNGTTIAMGEKFNDRGNMLDYPGDPNGAAESIINCRCAIGYERA